MSRLPKCQLESCRWLTLRVQRICGLFAAPAASFWATLVGALLVNCPDFLLAQGTQTPAIINQPQNEFVYAGATAIFSVTASGAPPLSYRWSGPNGIIPGETNATLKIPGADLGDQGAYFVRVFNTFGSTQSV